MVADVVFHEGCHQKIAVVIAFLQSDIDRLARVFAGLLKQMGFELFLQKRISSALVD